MPNRALTFGFGGYVELDVTFGEFVSSYHTLTVRYMPQYPYGYAGALLADGGDTNAYSVGQGNYRAGTGDYKQLGQSTLRVVLGDSRPVYLVRGLRAGARGPVG